MVGHKMASNSLATRRRNRRRQTTQALPFEALEILNRSAASLPTNANNSTTILVSSTDEVRRTNNKKELSFEIAFQSLRKMKLWINHQQ